MDQQQHHLAVIGLGLDLAMDAGVVSNDIKVVQTLLERYGTLFNASRICQVFCSQSFTADVCAHERETVLFAACRLGHHEIAELLLTKGGCDPSVRCTNKDYAQPYRPTMLEDSIRTNKLKVFKTLLRHGADVGPGASAHHSIGTPLGYLDSLIYHDRLNFTEWLIALRWHDLTGHEIDMDSYTRSNQTIAGMVEWIIDSRTWSNWNQTQGPYSAHYASRSRSPKVVKLMEAFVKDPLRVFEKVGHKLGFAEELFSLVVMVCDNYLTVISAPETGWSEWARFFRLAARLPMEMQMLLCHRVFGSHKDVIPGKDFDRGWRAVATMFGAKLPQIKSASGIQKKETV